MSTAPTSTETSPARTTTWRRAISAPSLWLIRFYQRYLSPLKPPSCRFTPTCSSYALQAIRRYGPIKGWYLSTRRILKCHPFHPGGHDPLR